jgi:hypothetical protein
MILNCCAFSLADTEDLLNENAIRFEGQYLNAYKEGAGLGGTSSQSSGLNVYNLLASILFSGIGFVAFMYGKKNSFVKPMVIGGLLTGYSYFISETLWVYVVGIGLTACLYFFRD